MKTFGYTLRNKEGALKKGSLQAVDRTDALRQIKAMGCILVSVSEGKSLAAGKRAPWDPATWNRAVWMSVAGVILIAALSVWRAADKKPAKRPAPAAAVAGAPPRDVRADLPASPPRDKPVPPAPQPAPSVAVTPPPEDVRDEPAQPMPAVASKKPPRPAPEPQPAAEEQKPPRPGSYSTRTEQLLAMALSVPPGVAIPPLPISQNLDADFVSSLTNEIVIYDDDDERTAATKENVAVAKNQMLELIKQGQSVSEVLKEYQETTNERAAVRNAAQRQLAELLRSGTPAEAKEYLDKVNKAFAELGVDPIAMPRPRPR